MRYTVDTRLRPGKVLGKARDYFGPHGKLGLELTEPSVNRLTFQGGSGFVALTVFRVWNGTRLVMEVWQFDTEARAFLDSLPPPGGTLSRLWSAWLGRQRGGSSD